MKSGIASLSAKPTGRPTAMAISSGFNACGPEKIFVYWYQRSPEYASTYEQKMIIASKEL